MANYFLCMCLMRIGLPICLGLSIIFRPSLLSVFYLILLLYLPMVPVASTRSMAGHTGCYLKVVIGLSFLTAISQLAFQIVLLSMSPYGHFLINCELLERILRHVGLVRINELYAISIIQWFAPEVIMLLSSISVYVLCSKLTRRPSEMSITSEQGTMPVKKPKKTYGFLVFVGRYISLASLCVAGVLRPSVPGAFYFLIFIGAATWWACYKELRRGYAIVLRCVMVVLFFHMSVLYAYQFQWPQEFLERNSTYARYFGLTPIMSVNCTEPREILFNQVEWATYLNPLWLYWLFYILALESRMLLMPQLIRGVSPSRKYGVVQKSPGSILQDSTGSVTITGDGHDDIPMQPLEEELQSGFFENVAFGLASFFQVLVRSSYIVTNIIMMAWSITYHSWLTFVLLLLANLFWLLPNKRRAMLQSSPFLVMYVEFLLLSAYVYSMDLTEEELPSTIQGINLAQIGFQKITSLPCIPLIIKSLYATTFWFTLRQYMAERHEARQSSTIADMVAPLQVTVGAATTAMNADHESKGDKRMKNVGDVIKKIATKFWIWIVAITLFGVAITGERMTGFRIIYMFLFLLFILTFQMSYTIWRKIMFGFWLTVIGYSMLTLVLVYTYQFDNFPHYWSYYLHIPEEQQRDIGLELYETKQLFVRLLTPTFFVVMTVIQVHYFHKDFMELSDTKSRNPSIAKDSNPISDASSAQEDPWRTASEITQTEHSTLPKFHMRHLRNKAYLLKLLKVVGRKINKFISKLWLFLELHMFKIVILTAMLLCVYDVCAMHFAFLILAIFGLTMGRGIHVITVHLSSLLVSIMLLAKMIYQIQYIDHNTWNVDCDNKTTNNSAYNNAKWLGFEKTNDEDKTLPRLVKWYIGFILILTVRAIVLIKQRHKRIGKGKHLNRPFFLFPKIKRTDADKSVACCLMYLANYGFYKFGLEICLTATVALIGTRMDFYAVLYGIWLCVMFAMRRRHVAKIWNCYLAFIAFMLPIQYLMVVGLPPGLCLVYPWEASELMRRVQDWMYLMDIEHKPASHKLLCDIFLLILVARQSIVFRIEHRYDGADTEYLGGSNKSIIHHIEEPGFVNPVPDFVTYVRSWLDIFKRGVLTSFMWITLAIMFLAGTNRVNIFSIGYLIGTFVFLWDGSDLYLKPISHIMRSWNCLLGYNVFVIITKTALQIIGCIFIKEVQENACWLIQLLGIGCIKKFGNAVLRAGITDPSDCTVPREDIGLAWDGVCFAFLLFQRRLFASYNFFHIIDETKATTILASRGAELIEDLRESQMHLKKDQESKILEKIKQKMEKIKANQQKIHGDSFKETDNHFIDKIFPGSRPTSQKRPPRSNREAIRSGDYYMFDDEEDEELDLITEKDDVSEDESDDLKPVDKSKTTVGQGKDSPRRSDRGPVTIVEEPKHEIEKEKEKDEPKPGSSKEYYDEEMSLLSDLAIREESKTRKLLNCMSFCWAFIESVMNSITSYLNKFSKDYRYVLRVLSKEKKLLKERTQFSIGVRRGSGQIWEPVGSFQSLLKQSQARSVDVRDAETVETIDPQPSSLDPIIPKKDPTADAFPGEYDSSSPPVDIMQDYEGGEMSSLDQPPFIRLLHAIWYLILSHSDLGCYFMIFLNQIKSPTILTLPLPLMVFLWGSLTIPRPSKSFWVTIIAYTEVIVLIKCVFQFEILPWNQAIAPSNHPFYAPRIIGIERTKQYATYDLLLLLFVFFHRFMLKTLGLWKSSFEQPSGIDEGVYQLDDDDGESPHDFQKSEEEPSKAASSGSKKKYQDSVHTGKSTESSRSNKQNEVQQGSSQDGDDPNKDPSHGNSSIDSKEHSAYVVHVTTTELLPLDNITFSLKMTGKKYTEHLKKFCKRLLDPSSRITADVYAYMFLCDFFNFMVVIFGFAAFGSQQGDGGVSAYLQENKVPIPFLLMLILQFVLIIVDRALFLRKYILGKIIFQFLQIIGVHIWMFFVLPAVTDRNFNALLPPQMWYMVKCFYLLLSSYQIRCGYPTRILGNFLCKGYSYVNMFLFKAFMIIPFLFELRTVMDWMWTDTSMTIFDWLKMEDIFAHIFQLKCTRHVENEYPQPRGEKKSPIVKYFMGGAVLFAIIAVIWFPLVFFALGKTVGQSNLPHDVTVHLRIGPYQPIYSMTAQADSIIKFSSANYLKMKEVYKKDRVAQTFLSSYEYDDIAAVRLNGNSTMVWSISPPELERMIKDVKSQNKIVLKLEYIISRNAENKQDSGVVTGHLEFEIVPEINGVRNPTRDKLGEMLAGEVNMTSVLIEHIFPKFVKVTNRPAVQAVTQLMTRGRDDIDNSLRNVTIKLTHSHPNLDTTEMWWELKEECNDFNYEDILKYLPHQDCNFLTMFVFNEKSFPASLSFLSGGGIIGLYTTLVLVVSRMIRGFFSEICFKIMFDDMPNVDRILQLCHDIYLVREARELCLEEDLFAKLVFLFRSPETLIKWTRPKDDDENDGDDPDDEPQDAH